MPNCTATPKPQTQPSCSKTGDNSRVSRRGRARRRRQRIHRQLARSWSTLAAAPPPTAPEMVVMMGLGQHPQPASVSGAGRLYGKIHRHPSLTQQHANPGRPWALVRWRSDRFSYRMIEPVARFASREQAVAAAAVLTADEPWTVVRTDVNVRTKTVDEILAGRRPANDDDDDHHLDDDEPPPKRKKGESLRPSSSHPWRDDGVSAATRSDAGFFSDLQSKIPPAAMTGTGTLGA
jgi:hypothetical protein